MGEGCERVQSGAVQRRGVKSGQASIGLHTVWSRCADMHRTKPGAATNQTRPCNHTPAFYFLLGPYLSARPNRPHASLPSVRRTYHFPTHPLTICLTLHLSIFLMHFLPSLFTLTIAFFLLFFNPLPLSVPSICTIYSNISYHFICKKWNSSVTISRPLHYITDREKYRIVYPMKDPLGRVTG